LGARKGVCKMENFLKTLELYQQAISLIDEKILVIKENNEISNSDEKIGILVETKPLVELTFDVIYQNFPNRIKDLTIIHSSLKSVVEQFESILNLIGFNLFITSKNTFKINGYY